MSFVTGTNTELLYANTAAGTAKNTFTSEAQINDTAGMGAQASIPPWFYGTSPTTAGKAILVKAFGTIAALAASTPTYTFSVRLGAAGSTSACLALGTAAVTMQSGGSGFFTLEGLIVVQAPAGAAGANTTLRGTGEVRFTNGAAGSVSGGPWIVPAFGGAASPGTVATLDTSITNFLNFNVACSASSASNQVQLLQLAIFGLN